MTFHLPWPNHSLIGMVLSRGMTMVGVGFLIGAVMAFFAAGALSSVLFVPAFDIPSFGISLLQAEGKQLVKRIVVPGRLVNLVVK